MGDVMTSFDCFTKSFILQVQVGESENIMILTMGAIFVTVDLIYCKDDRIKITEIDEW